MITIYKMTRYGAKRVKVTSYDRGIAYIAKHTKTTIKQVNENIEKGMYIFNIDYGYSYYEIEI